MFLNSRWQDVTDQVLVRDRVAIRAGSPDESTEGTPLTSLFTMKNTDLQWAPANPLSPYASDLTRNVPVLHELRLGSDDFDRTVSAGLGTTTAGQMWSTLGAGGVVASTDISISTGLARFSVPAVSASRSAYIVGELLENAVAECAFQLPTSNVTGGDLEPGNLLLRVLDPGQTQYLVRAVVTAADTVTVALLVSVGGVGSTIVSAVTVPGLTNTGQRMRVKGCIEGQTFSAKVWDEAVGEPLDYQVTGHTSHISGQGTVGVRCGVAASNTNALPVVFNIDDFSWSSPRFRGESSSITLADNEKGTDRNAKFQAAGLMRRLGQGTAPVMSSLKRGYLGIGATLINYWPCEDGTSATSIASAVNQAPMHMVGSPNFASDNDFPCSQPLPVLHSSAWFGDVPGYTFSGQIQCRFLTSILSASPPPDNTVLIRLFGFGTVMVWELLYLTGGGLKIKAFNTSNNEVYDSGTLGFDVRDIPARLSFELQNNGANVDWRVSALSITPGAIAGFVDGTVASFNCGQVLQVMAGPQGLADRVTMGHISLESLRTDLFANLSELQAWYNEDAVARLRRLCTENGLPFSHYEGGAQDAAFMGYQRPLRLVDLFREIETTDGGVLFEPLGSFGIAYRTRRGIAGQAAKLTAAVDQRQVGWPFRPKIDDQRTRNDVTVEQPGGSSARAEQTTGPMSTQDYPDGIGRVDTTVSVNTSSTNLLPNHAEWRLALGVTPDPRVPDAKFNIDATPIRGLRNQLLDVRLADRVVFTGAGAKTGYYDALSQLTRSIAEEWTNHTAEFTLNTSPEGPFAVSALDGTARLDSGSSTLSGDLSASAVGTFSVATAGLGDLWITTATHQPDSFGTNHFPMDIMIGGERITISAITGATSPQTFTISARGVNGVAQPGSVGMAHASGAEVHVFEPYRLGL